MTAPLLAITQGNFAYSGSSPLLEDFNFELNHGDFAGIIGPSGAGKTTVFRVLTGYVKLRGGKVSIKSKDIHSIHGCERSKIMAVVPQEIFSPLPYTVRQIVEMGRAARIPKFTGFSREDHRHIDESLEYVKIDQYAKQLFNNLSGGEKQRVMIAMALAQDPEILLLDEPTASLDISLRTHIMKLLKNLNSDRNITIAVISHDIQLAAGYCNRLILMNNGKIAADGKVEDILSNDLIRNVYNCNINIINQNGKFFIGV